MGELFMDKFKILVLAFAAFLGLSSSAHAEGVVFQPSDFVGISFWIVSMGMLAATVFFFVERESVGVAWKTPITVAGLVTGVAFVHYMYLRGVWVETADAPTVYRYVDWLITMPLQIVEFYLVLSVVRKVKTSIFWKLLGASLVMVVGGYLGESKAILPFFGFVILIGGWIYIIFEIFSGEAGKLASRISDRPVVEAFGYMRMIVAIGWAIYPLGYIFGYLNTGIDGNVMNVIYNLTDFVNKIAFGLVIWIAAK